LVSAGLAPPTLAPTVTVDALIAPDELWQAKSRCWCGRGDSNPHGLATVSPSSWCVCQFRHFRKSDEPPAPQHGVRRGSLPLLLGRGRSCWSGLGLSGRGLQHRARGRPGSPDRQHDACRHKNGTQHPGNFGERSDRAARTEGRLARSAKSRRHINIFSALDENNDDQQYAHQELKNCNCRNHKNFLSVPLAALGLLRPWDN
jgi:hypothetical protein